jgi:predicted nucleotidyltransferase
VKGEKVWIDPRASKSGLSPFHKVEGIMGTIIEEIPLVGRIKEAVADLQPQAEVILYGSRARGTSTPVSDWDVLILVPHDSRVVRQALRRRLYEIEWACGEVISVVVREKSVWNNPKFERSPFHRNVEKDGIRL